MKHPKLALVVLAAAVLFASAACTERSTTDIDDDARPWLTQFTFGNTSINTGDVVTNQDGESANTLVDWVSQSALPNTSLELFITHVWIPTASSMSTRITNGSVTAGFTNGARTANFFRDTEFVQRSTINGVLYDIHRLEGLYLGTSTLTPSTFANVVFTFRVEHLSSAGAVLNASQKTIEIYKR